MESQEEQLPVRLPAGAAISEDKGATAWGALLVLAVSNTSGRESIEVFVHAVRSRLLQILYVLN